MSTFPIRMAAIAAVFVVVFATPGTRAFGEDESIVSKKAKQIKRLVKRELFPYSNVMGVLKTGQTVSYGPEDDGDLQKGVRWPDPRFLDHEDGTVTDQVTGLMWVKDAGKIGEKVDWHGALKACNEMEFAGHDNWRLPNVRELLSVIDYGAYDPALPKGHPFVNVQTADRYWSSTTVSPHDAQAWSVGMMSGSAHRNGKGANLFRAWPVRRGTR